MRLSSYDFLDEWKINAPLDNAWEAISDSSAWGKWWPGLKSADITNHTPQIVNSSIELIWRSKTGYTLRHRITITAIKPKDLIEFTSAGDLRGSGMWSFKAAGENTHMVIAWHVQTTKTWMNIFSVFLRPVFEHNHHTLMKRGEAGLNNYLHP